MRHFRRSDSGPVEAAKYKDMGQMAGKPPHFSTLLHHLFTVQGPSVSRQRVEACLQTTVEHYPWFPDEGIFNLEIWHQVKENVERAARRGKNIPIDFWPLWALIIAEILPFQGNSSPPDIRQQTECLLHEHELDDETLQKAQLEQHKIFQNFPTSPAPAAPNAPPLPTGANPKVSLFLELNDSDDSPETLCDTKTGNTFLDNNAMSLAQIHICKKLLPTHSPLRQRHSDLLALQSQVSEADGFFCLPSFRKCKCSKANNISI